VPDARDDPAGFAHAVAAGAVRASARVVLPGTERGLLALGGLLPQRRLRPARGFPTRSLPG
jgi:hypothetical protein